MATTPNEEINSQSSQLAREEDLQKLVGDGGNNACSSSMAGSEVKVNSLSSSSETRSVWHLSNSFLSTCK